MALAPATVKLLKFGIGLMLMHMISMNLLHVEAQVVVDESRLELMSDALEWPMLSMSFDEEEGEGPEGEGGRRSIALS